MVPSVTQAEKPCTERYSGSPRLAALDRKYSHSVGIELIPIDGQWLQLGRFDETEAMPTNGRERVARVSGQFTFQFTLGHGSESFAKRRSRTPQARSNP